MSTPTPFAYEPDRAPFASGRDSDVYALDGHRALRRYRNGGDVAAEAEVMAYLAAAGFGVPAVHDAQGPDLVMDRVDGPTMLAALLAGDMDVTGAATMLAGLHHRLHELPARLSCDPYTRILHGDLHPDNVILAPAGPVLIDWRDSTEGPPDLDVATTSVILAQVAVDETSGLAATAGELLSAFLANAVADVPPMLDEAVAIRRANPAMTAAELKQMDAAADLVRRSGRSAATGRR